MRVIAGPEKKARLLSEKEQRIMAYHEMGHALVGHFLEHTDPVYKITIVSRGQALGLTISLPTEDRYMMGKTALIHTIAMTLGGRGPRISSSTRSRPAPRTTSRRSPISRSGWSCATG